MPRQGRGERIRAHESRTRYRSAKKDSACAHACRAGDRDQLEHFLAVTAEKEPCLYPLFMLMGRTGIRLGEALALKWDDVHFAKRELRVERAVFNGESKPRSS
jgi:integrase